MKASVCEDWELASPMLVVSRSASSALQYRCKRCTIGLQIPLGDMSPRAILHCIDLVDVVAPGSNALLQVRSELQHRGVRQVMSTYVKCTSIGTGGTLRPRRECQADSVCQSRVALARIVPKGQGKHAGVGAAVR